MTIDEAVEFRRKIEQASAWTDDADALEMVELFPEWKAGKTVIVGERLREGDALYKCIQAHTTQADWQPSITPALWVRVYVEEYPEWVQPTGAADAYNEGDKVSHNDKHWVSLINGNVWEPNIANTWEEE